MSLIHAEKEFEKSQVFKLTVSNWKVLLALAYDGQENPYQVAKKHKMPYPVVHRAVKTLKELGWIRVMCREKNIKNVRTAVYGLTDKGLLWFFSRLPKEIPHKWFEESWEKDASKHQERNEAPNPEDLKVSGGVSSLVRGITTDEDVHLHLLFDLDFDRIAEKNAQLFPLVFGPWKTHKDSSMSGHMTFSFPETAFSTLVEIYYGDEGLFEKYGSLDEVFAYKVYKKTIESCAHIEPDKSIESDVECVQRVEKWMRDVSMSYPKAFHLYMDIALELQKSFSSSLSFTKEIVKRLGQDDLAR